MMVVVPSITQKVTATNTGRGLRLGELVTMILNVAPTVLRPVGMSLGTSSVLRANCGLQPITFQRMARHRTVYRSNAELASTLRGILRNTNCGQRTFLGLCKSKVIGVLYAARTLVGDMSLTTITPVAPESGRAVNVLGDFSVMGAISGWEHLRTRQMPYVGHWPILQREIDKRKGEQA